MTAVIAGLDPAIHQSSEMAENASSISNALSNHLKPSLFFVMAGLDPAIHVFLAAALLRRGCPAQGRA
jgi:hypothetical protein